MQLKNAISLMDNSIEDINIIRVVSAITLSDEEKKKIEKSFSARHEEKVFFSYSIDSLVLGGVLIIDGEQMFDGTIRGQLTRIRHKLIK